MHSAAPAPTHQSSAPKRCRPLRQVVQTTVMVLIFLLIFRSLAAEPYHVPTGSMWPALAGNHRAVSCPRCGYRVIVGRHRADRGTGGDGHRYYGSASCPNCGQGDLGLEQVAESPGDHLLVNKLVFEVRRPRRWEMIVFRCPADPTKAFVKRVVGLPGETVRIRDGDVYINEKLARKTLDEIKAVRIPVFDNNFQPAPDGFREHWETQPTRPGRGPLHGTDLCLDADGSPGKFQILSYKHFSEGDTQSRSIRDEYAYNCGEALGSTPVHDFMMEFDIKVERGAGRLQLGITDGKDLVVVEAPVGPEVPKVEPACVRAVAKPSSGIATWNGGGQSRVLARVPSFRIEPGRTHHVEMAFVDRRVSLRVDGALAFRPIDLPPAGRRREVSRPIRIGARGVNAVISGFRLYRDVHYTQAGANAVQNVVSLAATEYFVLGDNSPNSDDSRFWPGRGAVAERLLIGKPFLAHLPSRVTTWTGSGKDRRQKIAPDWGRIRWLH